MGVDPLAEVTVTSTHKSGQKFLIGSHLVQYTVKDRAGLPAKCSFKVDVLGQLPYLVRNPVLHFHYYVTL